MSFALLISQYRYTSGVEQLSADVHLFITQNHQQHILLKNLYHIRLSPSSSSLSSIVTFILRAYHKLSEH